MKKSQSRLKELRSLLKKIADPAKAPQMQAYMKSSMPYHGVPSLELKKACKTFFKDIHFSDYEDWQDLVLELWRGAKFREERYVALYVAGHPKAKKFQTIEAMDLYEELIVTGAWWDYVDVIASHRVGAVLANDPKQTKKLMLEWSKSTDMWKRRAAILCQLGAKDKTDLDFLYKCIQPAMSSNEFFLRKAIGWALRQLAWKNPKEVIRYVKENKDKLSALSKREALKNVLSTNEIKKLL